MVFERRRRLLGVALLVAFTVVFYRGVAAGGDFYLLDFHQTFQPLRAILGEALREGWPGWTNRLSNGTSISANPMYGLRYPPNLLFAQADPARALTLLTVLHATRAVEAPCIASGLVLPIAVDDRSVTDDGFYYLVRRVNACGPAAGEGWGIDSLGTARMPCP